ncbi:carboxyl transferase domain-containing protein [Nocardia sp. NBC_00403]|uniref:carboxyl transferase domain-containing protein n=1 Tax=Nocardia sp. NBC_00403 TaxID=2975990 RepID=UPI003FA564D3
MVHRADRGEGAASAVGIVGKRELAEVPADQRSAVRDFMINSYNAIVATPWIAAERGHMDAVIEPARTRLEIRHALRLLREKEAGAEPNPSQTQPVPDVRPRRPDPQVSGTACQNCT